MPDALTVYSPPHAWLLAQPLLLSMDLPKPVDCKVYAERGAASTAGHAADTMGQMYLRRGAQRSIYVSAPTVALPAWVSPSDTLVGQLLVDKGASKVGSVPLMYEVPPPAAKKADAADSTDDAVDDAEEDEAAKEAKAVQEDAKALEKALLEAMLSRLSALRMSNASSARYTALSSELILEHRNHLPLLLEMLAWERSVATAKEGGEGASSATSPSNGISNAVDAMLAPEGPIDPAALAQYFGVAADDPSDLSKAQKKEFDERKKEMEEQRTALRLALYSKAASLAPAALELAEAPPADDAPPSPFVLAVREMRRWVTKPEDLDADERDGLALTLAKYELAHARGGAALAGLQARLKASPSKSLTDDVIVLYRMLGWGHWAANAAECKEKDYPRAKTPL